MKVLHIPKGVAFVERVQNGGELLCRCAERPERERQRQSALRTLTLNTKAQPRSQLLLLTQKPLHSLTAELTSSSRLMIYFQFFSSVPH